MKCKQLIQRLSELAEEIGGDPEVRAQSCGCCGHGHEIERIVMGGKSEKEPSFRWEDEEGVIIIRV